MKGTMGILVDVLLIFFTGGLWFIWILVRFLRAHSTVPKPVRVKK
jgi:hypothetical protein